MTPVRFVLVAALTAATPAAAQIHRWVDDQGTVNYTSRPPRDNRPTVRVDRLESRVSVIPIIVPKPLAQPARATAPPQPASYAIDSYGVGAPSYTELRERCFAQRRTDCDDPYAVIDSWPYATPFLGAGVPQAQRAVPGLYRPTNELAVAGGGVVGPYLAPPTGRLVDRRGFERLSPRPPQSGFVVVPGTGNVGATYGPAAPGGVVIAPGSAGIGARYLPVAPASAPQGRGAARGAR